MWPSDQSSKPRVSFAPSRPPPMAPNRGQTSHRPAPAAPSGGSSSGQPARAAPSGMSWARLVGAGGPTPVEFEIAGNWFTEIPKGDEVFIRNTALRIAKDFNCKYVGIRSAVHNTATYITPEGKHEYKKAAWHFTAEFQHRDQPNRWMSAHIYTDTHRATAGPYRYETRGVSKDLERLEREWGVQANPERFPDTRPRVLRMKKFGDPFGVRFNSAGYKPTNW